MPTTLLTGANGFFASQVLNDLINDGHHVIGQVRDPSKSSHILATHPSWRPHTTFVTVPDYATEGAWDAIFQEHDIDFVIHTGAPLIDNPANTDFVKHYLEPNVKGAIGLLTAAHKYGKRVKTIAVTGSMNAMTTGADIGTRVFNSSSWLPVTIADATTAQNPYLSYCVSKAESEKAIWSYIATHQPSFSVSVLLPTFIFGPPLQHLPSLDKLNFSSALIYAVLDADVVPPTPFPAYVDSRDLSKAHIRALTTKGVANRRFVVGGRAYSSWKAIEGMRGVEGMEGRLPRRREEEEEELGVVRVEDVEEWNRILGLELRSEAETFGDMARRFLELEREFEWEKA